jgi:hypothetical protein
LIVVGIVFDSNRFDDLRFAILLGGLFVVFHIEMVDWS